MVFLVTAKDASVKKEIRGFFLACSGPGRHSLPMRDIRLAAAAAVTILVAASVPAGAGAQPSPPPPSTALETVRSRAPEDPDQRKSYGAMIDFVHANAAAAGADAACESGVPDVMRECTKIALSEWDHVSGLEMIRDDKLVQEMTEIVWVETYDRAKAVQSGPDATASCAAVEERIRAIPVMKVCLPDAENRARAAAAAAAAAGMGQRAPDLPPLHVD
jgi:hypothetical protein